MRVSSRLPIVIAAVAMLFVQSGLVLAGAQPAAKPKKKDRNAATPAVASGVPRDPDAKAAAPYDKTDTVRTYRNAQGETVYAVSPSHFDLSAPLSDMAAGATLQAAEEDEEGPTNPVLPSWRQIRSDRPDPVVQPVVSAVVSLGPGGSPAAPTTGFNFLGVGINGGSPSDSNGSVGNNQFVETVNTRYQVWSLNHSTKVATSALGPANINTLWSGFTGACETQNSGDPIVLYDKIANRWLISQFTTGAVSGVYFQCVAISQTASATGTYYRYAFAVPGNIFGDYPHFGVWSDAYYMMAHGFASTAGGYVAALFAAMDRTKMLAGDASATWQVIQDPSEGGHMPADLDGFALPPTGASGIFLSLHGDGMYIYRMKVDFAVPANTAKTIEAIVPVAPANGACGGGGSCIPQPGTTVTVGSLADRLMFRAAYRNMIDHESLVISHSVDPSVSGVVSGVRWYDFRLSGTPNATCPTYPCVYQQGTVADVAGGRSRWMPSIAMDTAENILVGYSTTGKTAGSDNHSIRYTGRAKNDPPGTMTAPEVIIATGTQNNTGNSRWGDYSSMSIDPFDDCTFWYVAQYYTVANSWSTRVASASFPPGTGAGQCPLTNCAIRPAGAPSIGSASAPSDNTINVTWSPLSPTPGSYAIERATGACGSEGVYRPLGAVAGSITTYTDTSVLGGLTYSYRVIAAADAGGKCQSKVVSACTQATATGTCNLAPTFSGATSAASHDQSSCGVTVNWGTGATSCPLTPNLRYNVYRGTTPDFVPAPSNRIATCVAGPNSYLDTNNLASGTSYYYVVRAEDDSTGNGGPCAGGNEDGNSVKIAGTAYGAGTQATPGTWTDGGGDGTGFLRLNAPSPGNTGDQIWRFVKTVDDAGANHTPGGAYAYRNAGPGPSATYPPNACAEMQAPPVTAAAATIALKYWERHQIEFDWDGLAVEYSVNGGPWLDAPLPSNDVAAGCEAGDAITGYEEFTCTQNPPINACGYGELKRAYNGPFGGGTTCNDFATGGSVTSYAHRCHPITDLSAGDQVLFRWRFSSDPGAEFAGFYLDDIAITNVRVPNACAPDTCAGAADGTACNDGSACTAGDTCGGGTCQPGVAAPAPAEVSDVLVNAPAGTTLTWTDLGGGAFYDVASSSLSDLRAHGTATATCIANDVAGTAFVDARPDPAAGDGYYYILRGQSTCGTGTYGDDSSSVERVPANGCP